MIATLGSNVPDTLLRGLQPPPCKKGGLSKPTATAGARACNNNGLRCIACPRPKPSP